MIRRSALTLTLVTAMVACGGSENERRKNTDLEAQRSKALAGSAIQSRSDAKTRCDSKKPNREVSEYDTSGDNKPDVRKVFLRINTPPVARLILICRETDLNSDGRKDMIRYYNDEGRPLREEADRDFDGRMDVVTYFENGALVREEIDSNRDGKVDMKVFYDEGKPVRTERDLTGRSTATAWRPDRWEYFENGRLVRMGTDLTADSRVDRWDRDLKLKPRTPQAADLGDEDPSAPSAQESVGAGDATNANPATPPNKAAGGSTTGGSPASATGSGKGASPTGSAQPSSSGANPAPSKTK